MKTLIKPKKTIAYYSLLFLGLLLSISSYAQTNAISVKGTVTSDFGPLEGVSIYLKNSKTGTVTKKDGTFTFPGNVNLGDVLIFSYLGFEKQSVVIGKNSTSLSIFMKEAPIDVLSSPNPNKPYKSKRPKPKQ